MQPEHADTPIDAPVVSTAPNSNPEPSAGNPAVVRGGLTLQPINDMSAYAASHPAQQLGAAAPAQAVAATADAVPQPATSPVPPFDASKIYPTAAPTAASAPPQLTSARQAAAIAGQRVASRVPSVQVYAFVILAYSIYSIGAVLYAFSILRRLVGTQLTVSALGVALMIVAGVTLVNIAAAVYLLVAKNIRTVHSLLTALLIIGGIGFAHSLLSFVRNIAHTSLGVMVGLFISGGLLMYLWSVRGKVADAILDEAL